MHKAIIYAHRNPADLEDVPSTKEAYLKEKKVVNSLDLIFFLFYLHMYARQLSFMQVVILYLYYEQRCYMTTNLF